jgi:hypothetical protein
MGLSCVFTESVIPGNFIMPFQGGYVVSWLLPRALPWAVLFCPFRAVALRPEGPAYYSSPVLGSYEYNIIISLERAKESIQALPYHYK